MITVEDLIKNLEKVKDKSKPVFFSVYEDDAEYIKVYEYGKQVVIEQVEYE